MHRLHTITGALAIGAATFFSGGAAAHPKLLKTEPAAGAVLEQSPKTIAFTFNEPLEAAFSTITLRRADGVAVAAGAARIDPAAPTTLTLPAPPLAAGAYQAHYAVIGKDGHRREGDSKFSVK